MTHTESLFKTITLLQHLSELQRTDDIDLYYIDLFCGAGGTSTGVELATTNGKRAAKVIACVNHDTNAIASHRANHPHALHFTEDMRTLDLSPIANLAKKIRLRNPNAKFVLWASLECTNFSKAKGGQSRDADSRTLAEHLFRYIDAIDPDLIQIENVEEFMCWGDLDANGKPISKDKGRSYLRWVNNVKRHGYKFGHRVLNAADFGAYTSRKRFFGQFAKKGMPIAWPEPTHCKEGSASMFGNLAKWKAVKDVLDIEDEGKSIFTRKKPLSEKTLERIYAGLIKFVAGGKDKFLSRYNSVRPVDTCKSLDEPCGVLTTNNRFAKVGCHFLSKYFSGHPESKNIPVTGPAHTIKCKDNHSLISTKFLSAYYGNGDNVSRIDRPCPTVPTKDRFNYVSPKFLDMQYGNGTPVSVDDPAGTVTTSPKHNLVTVKPWVMNTNFANVGSRIEEPAPTITANRKWHYLMNPQFASPGSSVDDPCFTLIARMDKRPPHIVSLNTVFSFDTAPGFVKIDEKGNVFIETYQTDSDIMVKIKEFMAMYQIVDILMRMLKIPELKRIMGFPEGYKLIGTQAEQKKFIGNAVEVTMARVLCEALCKKIQELKLVE